MTDLTDHGRDTIETLAQTHGLSLRAVEEMARAMVRGGGTMAQFDIPELGGSGQWMAGGMTMVGDMFNSGLKVRVESLCCDLSTALNAGALFHRAQTLAGAAWWPEDLGQPASVGGQNETRYAYFPTARRIAFDPGHGATVILLDTLDHQIGGFSQQQSGPGDAFAGITFSSQKGQYALGSLPRIGSPAADAGKPAEEPRETQPAFTQSQSQGQPRAAMPVPAPEPVEPQAPTAPPPAAQPETGALDLLAILEKLAALRDAGILTEQEFSTKKAELLARL